LRGTAGRKARGGMVNRAWGDPPFLAERQEASDFAAKAGE
jgi:hypothetical protein